MSKKVNSKSENSYASTNRKMLLAAQAVYGFRVDASQLAGMIMADLRAERRRARAGA